MKTGLLGLGGKNPKPAGLALRYINGQSETKAAERRQRVVDITEGRDKESEDFYSRKVEIGTASSVKASVQQQQTGEKQVSGKVLTPCMMVI